MQLQTISKSQLKPRLLEYLRQVEENGKTFVITHNKRPVAKVVPIRKKSDTELLKELRSKFKLVYYKDPTEPVGLEDWEALK